MSWKISFLKSHSKKLEASSFNNIKWIGFYHLIKLRFCMGQNAGYFNKANQRYSFSYSVLKNCLKNKSTRNVKLFIVVRQSKANSSKICNILPQRKT